MTLVRILAIVLVILLIVEWTRRLATARIAAVLLAVSIMLLTQLSVGRAHRRALFTPEEERVQLGEGATQYAIGVATMGRVIEEDAARAAIERLVAGAALVWLSWSPVLRRKPRMSAPDGRASVA